MQLISDGAAGIIARHGRDELRDRAHREPLELDADPSAYQRCEMFPREFVWSEGHEECDGDVAKVNSAERE